MANITPQSLRCEQIDTPLQVHRPQPRLSWNLKSADANAKNIKQIAYRILAASTPELLSPDHADLWDSKRVESDSTLIAYAGKPLPARQRVFWKVASWNNIDATQTWSEAASFEMGLLAQADWKAKWIESPDASCKSPLFRKQFDLAQVPKLARAYLCGLGYSELYINNKKVSDRVLDPAQTDYETRCLYVAHDVTPFLKQGNNEIRILLGNGFYTQDRVWGGMSYGRPKLIFQLHAANKETTNPGLATSVASNQPTIISDKSWKTSPSAIIENNVYAGETHDARKETPDEKSWQQVEETTSPTKNLEPHLMPPIRHTRTIEPISIKQLNKPIDAQATTRSDGVEDSPFIIDLGENFAGVCNLTLENPPKNPIRLRTAETIHPDGSIDTASTGVFATNVEQIDTYTPSDAQKQEWTPKFTYHGFRYVEVSGLGDSPKSFKLQGIATHTDLEPIGTFECNDPTITRIYQTAIRTLTSNIHSIPTDCPAREKCGWLGDAHIASEFALCAFDAASFYDNYLKNIESSWKGDWPGDVAPGKRCSNPNGHLDWGLATIFIPWHIYLYTGDESIIRDHYPTMRRFFVAAMKQAKDGILTNGYGDWCPPGSVEPVVTPPALTTTALFAHAAGCMTQIAMKLSKQDDIDLFAAPAPKLIEAFNKNFYNAEKKTYGSQCANALALSFDLCPNADARAVAASLNTDVMETHKAHHNTGIFGTRYLHSALARNGYGASALALLRQTTYPSIGHLFALGATTFWECWGEPELDKKWGARSLNHVMQTAFAAWFYNGLAGINPHAAHPGFKRIDLQPQFIADEKLTEVKATHRSPHGLITSAWKATKTDIQYHCEIPPNTTAIVQLPDQPAQQIGSGSYDFHVKKN